MFARKKGRVRADDNYPKRVGSSDGKVWLVTPDYIPLSSPFFLALCLVVGVFLFGTKSVWATQPCNFPEDVPQTRPVPQNGGPTKVRAGYYVIDLIEVMTVKQQFTVDLFLEVEWKDSRLGNIVRKSGMDKCVTPMNRVWYPGLIGGNDRSLKILSPEVLYIHADGRVEEELRVLGTFGANFDLTNFPLDSQTLPIIWISTKYGPSELELVSEVGGVEKRLSEGGWLLKEASGCMASAQVGHRGSKRKVVFGSGCSCYAVFRS